jgi:hypothetical protein
MYSRLAYFIAVWYSTYICGHWVYFFLFWYVLTKVNLASLPIECLFMWAGILECKKTANRIDGKEMARDQFPAIGEGEAGSLKS